MCNNNWGGGNCCWIIILLIIVWFCCGNNGTCGSNSGNWEAPCLLARGSFYRLCVHASLGKNRTHSFSTETYSSSCLIPHRATSAPSVPKLA